MRSRVNEERERKKERVRETDRQKIGTSINNR